MTSEFALESMKVPSGQIHGCWTFRVVQSGELHRQFAGVGGLDAGFRTCDEELFQPGVPERQNHS